MPDPKFKWSAKRREYIYGNGRAVSADTLNNWISQAADNAEQRMRSIAQRFVDGEINTAEWVIATKDEMRAGVRGMAMLANGGTLDKKQLGAVGAAVRKQYGFFNDFLNAVENGEVAKGPALVARAGLYGANQFVQFQAFQRAREQQAGMTEEKNILGIADHCSGCLTETSRQWVTIGKLVPIGSRDCRARCRCHFEFR